jgi:hypothetical protein
MLQKNTGETWKPVVFDFDYVNENRIEVSNHGRIRSFNKMSDGNILKTPLVNGYQIIRLKFFAPRDEATDVKLIRLQKQVAKMVSHIKQMKLDKESKASITEAEKELLALKKKVSKKFAEATKARTIYYHSLVHRLVATYFLKQPAPNQTIVGHLDYNKLNNRAYNLKWMTQEENSRHQQNSPNVINDKYERKNNQALRAGNSKLTVTRVMLLKRMLNEGKPLKLLVKQFKITDTQILRIKRGENWANIKAAE